jgi:hypothetical protein
VSGQSAQAPWSLLGPKHERGAAPPAPEVPALPVIKDITVSPDKIVAVADVIEEQARALERKITEHIGALSLPAPADDIVSQEAVEVWNTVISGGQDSYRNRVLAYVKGLHNLADQLRAAGRRYQAGDEDGAAAIQDAAGR